MVLSKYQDGTQRASLQKLICAFELVGPKNQRIQRHVGQVEPGDIDF